MDNFDIFEYSDGYQSKQFILCIRSYNLAFAICFKDGIVKFYDFNMRNDLLGFDSEILVFKTMIVGNNDPLNISKLNTTSIGKSEDYENYSYTNIMFDFVFSASLSPRFKKIVIDGYSNVNYDVLQGIWDLGIRNKQIIIDATKAKAYHGQDEYKISIQ